MKGDYQVLLGLGNNPSAADVKQSYFSLAKKIHPDRLGQLGLEDLRPKATRLFNVLTQAYETMSDPQRRAEYRSGRVRAVTPTRPASRDGAPRPEEVAKIAFHKGGVMLSKRVYGEAEKFFRQATDANDKVARYWQGLGWAVFNNHEARGDKDRMDEAKRCYEKALELDEEDSGTHYYIALYWKSRDNMTRCRRALQKALEYKPDFIEAKRELRLMAMRKRNEKTKPGVEPEEEEPKSLWKKFVRELTKAR